MVPSTSEPLETTQSNQVSKAKQDGSFSHKKEQRGGGGYNVDEP